MIKRPEKDPKTVIERWIDERIQVALGGLTRPLEKRVGNLRERIRGLQMRVLRISGRLGKEKEQGRGKGKQPG